MRKIKTLRAFKQFLKRHKIDFSKWGKGPTKTVKQLFREYKSGETLFVIRKGRLIRIVRRVQVLVYYHARKNRYFLIEKRQVFRNGKSRKRSRARSLSEKMFPDESAKEAAARATKDELNVKVPPKDFKKLKASRKGKPIDSESYPGLPTVRHGPRFKTLFSRSQYRRRGYKEIQSDKTTEFRWRKMGKRK